MRYATFVLDFAPERLDEVESLLVMAGLENWTVPLELEAEDEPRPEVPAHAFGRVEVHAAEPDAEGTAALIESAVVAVLGRDSLRIGRLLRDEEDWAEGWKQHWHVQHLGRRLVIRPSWLAYDPEPGEIVLDIDPKQAFGTGTHATTRLALALLEDNLRPGESVQDVGCGTGVLSVAARKLGAGAIRAVDNDSVAVVTTRDNLERNGIREDVEVLQADRPMPWHADVVVANILADVLIDLAPELARDTGRLLILSGIIRRRVADVAAAFEVRGMRVHSTLVEDDWEAVVMEWPRD